MMIHDLDLMPLGHRLASRRALAAAAFLVALSGVILATPLS